MFLPKRTQTRVFAALCYIVKVHCKCWLYLTIQRENWSSPCLHNSAAKGKNVHVYLVHVLAKGTFPCPTALAVWFNTSCTHFFHPRALRKVFNEGIACSELRKLIYLQVEVRLSLEEPPSLIWNCKQKKPKSLKTELSQPRTNKRNDSISGLLARALCHLLCYQTSVILTLRLVL